MSLERAHEILDVLADNYHQSGESVDVLLVKLKNSRSAVRGPNSETFAKFIISQIPEVTKVTEVHEHIHNLDCDFKVYFINTDPVNVQVKSSDYGKYVFNQKLEGEKLKSKKRLRWVIVNLEDPFEKIERDFIDQVNALEEKSVKPLASSKFYP
ncbi:MAG TPA: hypothetical protein VKC54_02205 [Patescibacteria group bacterium]|nr:hypothetical protein [Patescibacteria group bacterium]